MNSTIAAIATAYGEGGISIIRISGEDAKKVLEKIFLHKNKKAIQSRVLNYGYIVDPKTKEKIDEVLCVYMKGPHTYTCEDVVEINCHGSIVSQQKILDLVLQNGAVLAEPGEFTKRAFLNGRLDLTQAEAVIDLVKAKTNKTFDVALGQLQGNFSDEIKKIRKELMDVLVDITVNIDYPDEDIEEITYKKLEENLQNINVELRNILSTADTGKIIKEGLKVSIIGKPNVGKSSLMNALLNESRAIVTEIPGTTRDTIEETISIKDIPVVITDTAGIRETEDVVEKIGIDKSKNAFNMADLVIFIVDASANLDKEDREIIKYLNDKKVIVLLNKSDKKQVISEADIKKEVPNCDVVETSFAQGKKPKGLDEIKNMIQNLVFAGEVKQDESLLITNARHKALLENSQKSIDEALIATKAGQALEFIEIDINDAYQKLGEVIGEEVGDDIIAEVFSRFCLGK